MTTTERVGVSGAAHTSEPDLKAVALRRFGDAACCARSFEIVERYATDAALMKGTLVDAVRGDRPDIRVCELGFGTGWLLKEMLGALPSATLWGLELSLSLSAYARRTLQGGGGSSP